jgi:thiamine biosynthesis protein ThiI
MEQVEHVVVTYHEIALKGGNRGFFERALLRNVRAALAGLPIAEISAPSRVVIHFAAPVPWPEVHARLATVFGLASILPSARVGGTYEQLEAHVAAHLGDLAGATFAIRCQRSDKRFPMRSGEIARRLGQFVRDHSSLAVNLSDPDVSIHVLVQSDGIFVYHQRFKGPGGLPVGTSGRVLVLLSGGIDSPAAAYMALKRGVRAMFLHFHSAPYTSDASVRKVEEIVRILNRHQGTSRLVVVPFGDCQREIVSRCPEALRVVLYRRMMLRVAARVARRLRCRALVTGEALNQVASQTLGNMATIDRVAHLTVLRPLVGMDKLEIIAIAERAGTYELSIQPHADCCSFLQPRHPATLSSPEECEAAEASLDCDAWARRLQRAASVARVAPAPWGGVAVEALAEVAG